MAIKKGPKPILPSPVSTSTTVTAIDLLERVSLLKSNKPVNQLDLNSGVNRCKECVNQVLPTMSVGVKRSRLRKRFESGTKIHYNYVYAHLNMHDHHHIVQAFPINGPL
nr:hypothetical protein [Chlorokybus atmophyticus]